MAEAPAPSAPAVADAPGQTLVRFVLIAGLGQVLCLCVALSGVTSQLLASEHHVSLPATQSVLNYLALAITFVPALWWQGGLSAALSAGWWRYLLLALADLQANYLMVLAYRYTSMASVQILDCFAIPCTMFLSHLFLHARYRPSHLCGAVLSTVGVLVLVASDGSTPDTHPTQWLGDCLCLLGAALYAVSNVGQELLVKQHTVVEFLAMIGLFGSMLAMLQALVLEGSEVLHVDWSWDIVYLLCGYSLCLYVFYVGVPLLLRLASASLLNVTLLCADAYSLLLASILFAHEFGPAYVISFAAIVLGILLYSCQPVDYQLPAIAHTMAPDSPWAVYHEDTGEGCAENEPLLRPQAQV